MKPAVWKPWRIDWAACRRSVGEPFWKREKSMSWKSQAAFTDGAINRILTGIKSLEESTALV